MDKNIMISIAKGEQFEAKGYHIDITICLIFSMICFYGEVYYQVSDNSYELLIRRFDDFRYLTGIRMTSDEFINAVFHKFKINYTEIDEINLDNHKRITKTEALNIYGFYLDIFYDTYLKLVQPVHEKIFGSIFKSIIKDPDCIQLIFGSGASITSTTDKNICGFLYMLREFNINIGSYFSFINGELSKKFESSVYECDYHDFYVDLITRKVQSAGIKEDLCFSYQTIRKLVNENPFAIYYILKHLNRNCSSSAINVFYMIEDPVNYLYWAVPRMVGYNMRSRTSQLFFKYAMEISYNKFMEE